jgi:hypothetical protein
MIMNMRDKKFFISSNVWRLVGIKNLMDAKIPITPMAWAHRHENITFSRGFVKTAVCLITLIFC